MFTEGPRAGKLSMQSHQTLAGFGEAHRRQHRMVLAASRDWLVCVCQSSPEKPNIYGSVQKLTLRNWLV